MAAQDGIVGEGNVAADPAVMPTWEPAMKKPTVADAGEPPPSSVPVRQRRYLRQQCRPGGHVSVAIGHFWAVRLPCTSSYASVKAP